jgi:hypothetical protein
MSQGRRTHRSRRTRPLRARDRTHLRQAARSDHRRGRWVAVFVIAAVLVVGLGWFAFSRSTHRSKLDINGTVSLTDAAGVVFFTDSWVGTGSHCQGGDGYYDITLGARIVITDESGTTLATTLLDTGLYQVRPGVASTCTFRFHAEVPTGKRFYLIAVAASQPQWSERTVVFKFDESSVRHAAITYDESACPDDTPCPGSD